MHKSVLAIIALALIGLTHAQVESSGDCPSDVTVQSNFNVSAYLGVWYEYAKYPVYFEADGKCVKGEYTLKDNGEIGVVNSMINVTNNEYSETVGYAVEVENAKLKVIFPVSSDYNVTTNYWILSTDYVNYSVVYYCRPAGNSSHKTVAWILTRERSPSEEFITIGKDVLTQNGVSLSELVVTDQSNCEAAADNWS
ncbi:PREDICTED: apolipoprotein D-like [Rhagoletis zephyria]|uniref:apolipoprotein D-like n=1 Tax=Rhagoletis zephyria TaxID=28612 RepID=UPI00081137F8|nr:PREDICTED: apolipoprotein D-like [Rhagoletis zephyria]